MSSCAIRSVNNPENAKNRTWGFERVNSVASRMAPRLVLAKRDLNNTLRERARAAVQGRPPNRPFPARVSHRQ